MPSLLFSKTKKDKIIDKLYSFSYTKEYVLTDIKLNEFNIDALIISTYGIFIFKIIINKDKFITLEEIKKEIGNHSVFLKNETEELIKMFNLNYEIKQFLIYKNKANKKDLSEYSELNYKNYIEENKKNVLNNETINELYKLIKPYSKSNNI